MSFWSPRAYALRRSLRLLAQRPGTLLLAVVLCAVALTLPLLAATLAVGARSLAPGISVAPELSVFLSPAANAQDVKGLQARVEAVPGVMQVRHIPREAALAELAERSGLGAPLRELKTNPLPDVLVVALAPSVAPATVDAVATAIRKLPRVDSVQFDSAWYRKLVEIGRIALIGSAIVGGMLLVLVAAVTIGAVRLLATASSEETSVLRIVGADEGFIARPYVYVGGAALALAAGLAVGAVAAVLRLLNPELTQLARLYGGTGFEVPMLPVPILVSLLLAALLFGLFLGTFGVRRPPRPKP
jgi:cell division transport system permease protein